MCIRDRDQAAAPGGLQVDDLVDVQKHDLTARVYGQPPGGLGRGSTL